MKKGSKHSEETKLKMRKPRIRSGWTGRKHSEVSRKKMRLAKLGKRPSKETRKKMSLAHKRNPNRYYFQKGHAFNLGKKMSEETKDKISLKKTGFFLPKGRRKDYRVWQKNIRNRVVKRLKVEGKTHTYGEWELLKQQYGFRCPSCGKNEPEIILTEDHIIPLSKGGTDEIENIQPLCRSCNCRKHTKIIRY